MPSVNDDSFCITNATALSQPMNCPITPPLAPLELLPVANSSRIPDSKRRISTRSSNGINKPNLAAEKIHTWSFNNVLELNPEKSQIIHFVPKNKPIQKLDISLDGSALPQLTVLGSIPPCHQIVQTTKKNFETNS
ncbi:hypothetical protein J437_LFUL002537 [Ladona fulva]|uniref:Uncharacterized protein n=1 Tax=Ladona fulva TaxID=123851 RepID=A0A8K0PEL6_LADFU|nr:hypothetical protein J437_LFUL002537 [Ladona fulva]